MLLRDAEVRMDEARFQAEGPARWAKASNRHLAEALRSQAGQSVPKSMPASGKSPGPTSPQGRAVDSANPGGLRVRAFIEEMDAPAFAWACPPRSLRRAARSQFAGRVGRISPRMERKELWSDQPTERYDTKTREVWIDLDDAKDLVVGLRVDAVIELGSSAAAKGANAE